MMLRRPLTLRKSLGMTFRTVCRNVADFAASAETERERFRFDMIGEALEGLRDRAVTSAAEAPHVKFSVIEAIVEKNDPDVVDGFIRRHMISEIREIDIEGVTPEDLANDLIEGLKQPGTFREIAMRVVKSRPEISAQDFHADMIETVLRESLGLDGRAPDPEYDEDRAAANAFFLRMTLGCPNPSVRDTHKGTTSTEILAEMLDEPEAGSKPSPGMMDAPYHLAMAHLAGDVFDRIEKMMGRPVPAPEREDIYAALEAAAMAAGPRISIETSESLEP